MSVHQMNVVGKRLISQREAIAKTSLSRTAIWMRVKAKTFPQPVRLGDGTRIAFVEQEIDKWIEACIADRDEGGGKTREYAEGRA